MGEIYLGKNVADFIDPDIMKKLEELEKEEELREAAGLYDSESEELTPEQEEIRKTAQQIREKKKLIVQAHREMKPRNNRAKLPRSTFLKAQAARSRKNITEEVGGDVEMEGIEEGDVAEKRSRSQTPMSRKRKRAASNGARSLSRPPR